jgi:hypothetical protein
MPLHASAGAFNLRKALNRLSQMIKLTSFFNKNIFSILLKFYVRYRNDKATEAFGLLSGKIWYMAIRIAKNVPAHGKAA